MSEPLDGRFLQLRRRIRQVVWLYGLSWLIAVLFGSVVLVGLIDWAIHLDDGGVRLIFALTILAGSCWIAWRRLVRPLRFQPKDVDLALQIEQRFPGFHDSLASTVEFQAKNIDPTVGSPELQQSVIQQTKTQAGRLNLSDIIETRPVRRQVGIAVAVCLISALLVGLNPVNAGIALNRLVFPFNSLDWPRTTNLRLLDANFKPLDYDPAVPLRLVQGDVLTIYVENTQGDLPEDLRMEYRYSDDDVESRKLRMANRNVAAGTTREVGIATLIAARGPVWFRAVGGDDHDKPLLKLEVVPPPLVKELQITLTPPAYSGKPIENLAQGVGHVEGLVGTQVEVTARTNKPLSSAILRLRGRESQSLDLLDNGRRLKTRFTIAEPGIYSYWFDLRDAQGFENPEAPRYEIRAIADLPPEVQIEVPATDQYVTAVADVPLKLLVRDDLGLTSVSRHYKLGNSQDESIQPRLLWERLPQTESPLEQIVEETWALSELSLTPGMRLVFYAAATDNYDLGSEHVGRSISRTLTIISPEEKKAELAARQTELLEELERLVKAQTQARAQVGELETQLKTVGNLRRSDIDLLKRIELDQRQITSRLLNPVDGFEKRTRDSIAELSQNKIDAPEMVTRLTQIGDEITALKQNLLPAVEQELTRARKAANTATSRNRGKQPPESDDAANLKDDRNKREPLQPQSAVPTDSPPKQSNRAAGRDQTEALLRAKENQDAVLESLNVMRDQLQKWRSRHDLLNELDEVIIGQTRVQQDAAEIARKTFGRSSLDKLTPQEEADLAKISARQQRQADSLEEFRQALKAQTADAAKPAAVRGDSLNDAEQHIKEAAIGSKMRQAADALKRNQVGIAAESQNQVANDLEELRNILTDRDSANLEMLVKKLKQAENDLLTLRKKQETLKKQTEETLQNNNRQQREQQLQQLQKEQQQVREQIARLSRRLRRLQAREASESAARATERLRGSEEQLQADNPESAAREQQESLDDLEQTQRELARTRREAEERLARELLERMADKLKLMTVMQQSIIDETERLEIAHTKRGSWSRGLLSSLKQLRETQENLRRDTEALTEDLTAVEVFVLALEGATRNMQRAIDRLGARQTDGPTVAYEQAAKRRFEQLVAALKPIEAANQPAPPGGAGGQPETPNQELISKLAEIKMLKSLQESLLQRTAELDEQQRKNSKLTDQQQQELETIAGDQGRLADLARNLMLTINEAIDLNSPDQEEKQVPADVPE